MRKKKQRTRFMERIFLNAFSFPSTKKNIFFFLLLIQQCVQRHDLASTDMGKFNVWRNKSGS